MVDESFNEIIKRCGEIRRYEEASSCFPERVFERRKQERQHKMVLELRNLGNMTQEQLYQFIEAHGLPEDETLTYHAVNRLTHKPYLCQVYAFHKKDSLGKAAKERFEMILADESSGRGLFGKILYYLSAPRLEDRLE